MRAYKSATGRLVFFKSTDKAYHAKEYTGLEVPCGYCDLCREEQARQQAVRITHEATCHAANSFVTMTYAQQHMPRYGSLDYRDLETFWKRLRKLRGELRYYAVGEYGDRTTRPHYHACIFGHDFTENAIICQQVPHRLWINLELTRCWGKGDVKVGALTFETARYTASYVTKKLRSKQRYVRIDEETGELIAVQQPKARMSKNLGKEWWTRWGHQLLEHDRVIINGTEQKPPKAYDRWLLESGREEDLQRIKTKRQEQAKKQTKEETHARAQNARARVGRKNKSI